MLFDQNLSPQLPQILEDLFPGSIRVRSIGLESADDRTVWEYATSHGFVIATKDSDFFGRAVLQADARVIWVAAGNSSSGQIESCFRSQQQAIRKALDGQKVSVFVLYPR